MPTCSKYVLDGWFILTYCRNVTYYIFNVLVLVSERQLTRGRPPRRRSRSSRRVAFHRSSTLCSLHTGLRCHLQYTHTHTHSKNHTHAKTHVQVFCVLIGDRSDFVFSDWWQWEEGEEPYAHKDVFPSANYRDRLWLPVWKQVFKQL